MNRISLRACAVIAAALTAAACTGRGNVVAGAGEGPEFEPVRGSASKDQASALDALEAETGASWSASFSSELGTPSFISGHTAPLIGSPGEAPAAAVRFLDAHRDLFKMADAASELAVSKVETDTLGHTHVRLAQVVAGVPVYGGDLGVHFDPSGAIEAIGGRYVPDVVHLNVTPSIAESDAVAAARARLAADRPGAAPSKLTAELLVFAPEGIAHLAYRVVADVTGPNPTRRVYFVDAHDGSLLAEYEGLESVAGSGLGAHGNRQTFDVTQDASGGYSLQTASINPNGIVGYTAAQQATEPGTLMTSTDPNHWDEGVYGAGSGVDAYVFEGITYAYYLNVQGRKGIDDNNLQQIFTVHYDTQYDNAFWDGSQMVFGDGDGTNFSAFGGSLDVIGHELTHGVTQYTSGLQYQDQSGALNEANSDIMGTFIEFWGGENGRGGLHPGNWLIGEDIVPAGSPYAPALRDMAHPKNGQQPDNMSGYVSTSSDNGGVHTNSGIINNALYLFANGGTNDTSGLAVSGLGLQTAEKIYFYASSHCYTSATDFAGAAACNVQAAKTLYGDASCEATTVQNAFIATGVMQGTIQSCGACTPTCAGKACGDSDGCGGVCQDGSGCTPQCTPACTGVACGASDGCGGTCQPGSGCTQGGCSSDADCPSGEVCQANQCVPACTPSCAGKVCGDSDGCGGSCAPGSGCTPACVPDCASKTCGDDDGCGGACQPGSGCQNPLPSETEPNDTTATATQLPMGASLQGAISTPKDKDYFQIVVPAKSFVHLHLGNLTDDCDMRLYTPGRHIVASSQNSGTQDEDIAGKVAHTTYYLKVYPAHKNTCRYVVTLTNQ